MGRAGSLAAIDQNGEELMARAVLVGLLLWPIAEIMALVLVADQIGWGPALLGLTGLSVLGYFVTRATLRSTRALATTDLTGAPMGVVGTQTADMGFRLLGAMLLLVPGYVSAAVGLLLLIPPVRALARAATGNAMVRRYPGLHTTVMKVRLVTTPGDVVSGEVVSDDPDVTRPDTPDENPPSEPPGITR